MKGSGGARTGLGEGRLAIFRGAGCGYICLIDEEEMIPCLNEKL